ncbi:hypothetical protein [Burkholderia sp. MSMB175]|nr:hypothetical protein [Burkholderia sp. MSMB175]
MELSCYIFILILTFCWAMYQSVFKKYAYGFKWWRLLWGACSILIFVGAGFTFYVAKRLPDANALTSLGYAVTVLGVVGAWLAGFSRIVVCLYRYLRKSR